MEQHRGIVVAKRGLVAASQPLAAAAGLKMLMDGGSFADAAIATSAVLCVTEPHASHLGGDAFLIVYEAATSKTYAFNGSGKAPQAATAEHFGRAIPTRGIRSVAVPGLVDVWHEFHQRWGRLSLSKVLEPAISYADQGYPVGFRTARVFRDSQALWQEFPATLRALTGQDHPPQAGQTIRQPALAKTLALIADTGREAFYEGALAEAIVRFCQAQGGMLSYEDLANHRTWIGEPIRTSYRGHTVHGQSPVSQGLLLLEELNLVEGFDLSQMGPLSADAIHVMVEAKKLAFADRARFLGDPDFVSVSVEKLLDKEYAAQRRGEIRMERASVPQSHSELAHDTTYFCVMDADGNAVSFIQSVFWGYGSGIVVEDTGILLNNRLSGFSLDSKSPNFLQPGKRPLHTLNAWLITRPTPSGERVTYVGGTPGADWQVQTSLQVICNLLDFGMNPQQALEAPRWAHGPSVPENGPASLLQIESRVEMAVIEALRRRGHEVAPIGPWAHGSACQLIACDDQTGALLGASDPRCDGEAVGF
ncbi:gamma-glutamyltransferase [Chthonomonas calidirosea]|uniref:gamma-glutamyltransferase n=1 Tax=Chthonomonas calidirosea TaxID=454171 RepID=UPI0006ECA38E|nr:gamma-glutamyltransferase [Chthonomonas calidirosea]CEK12544.1 gamma-glutamyltranspeptidase [Chthonomonas calidirosea]